MTIWRIQGRRALAGSLTVQGAKNAMLPILAASLLVPGESVLENCPALGDLDSARKILTHLGCETEQAGTLVRVQAKQAAFAPIPLALSGAMRASVCFLGSMLARFGQAEMCMPGGCTLGRRPIDLHLYAFRCLGAETEQTETAIRCRCSRLRGGEIVFPVSSVGATENAMLAACGAAGETVIRGAAREPEIVDLQRFLQAGGFAVSGAGTPVITVRGGRGAAQARHSIMPDRIAGATLLCAGAITGGDVTVQGLSLPEQGGMLRCLEDMGCRLSQTAAGLRLQGPSRLCSDVEITARPFPGFPTDALPLFMSLCASGTGNGYFRDTVFENRYRHVPQLEKMGAVIHTSGREAWVQGAALHGAETESTDLRGAAALVLAALAAEGESRVRDAGHIRRGYTDLAGQLRSLGAALQSVGMEDCNFDSPII